MLAALVRDAKFTHRYTIFNNEQEVRCSSFQLKLRVLEKLYSIVDALISNMNVRTFTLRVSLSQMSNLNVRTFLRISQRFVQRFEFLQKVPEPEPAMYYHFREATRHDNASVSMREHCNSTVEARQGSELSWLCCGASVFTGEGAVPTLLQPFSDRPGKSARTWSVNIHCSLVTNEPGPKSSRGKADGAGCPAEQTRATNRTPSRSRRQPESDV